MKEIFQIVLKSVPFIYLKILHTSIRKSGKATGRTIP